MTDASHPATTAICTWFVSDSSADATFFPQIGARSDTPEAKAIYWRCTLCFYASSVAVNPGKRHVFFTNVRLPTIDGVSVAEVFAQLGVETVELPITFRLASGSVGSWGNQFYVFDVIRYIAATGGADRWIILDSDCVWRQPIDAMEQAIDAHGAITYELDSSEHPEDEPINGLSRAGMAAFLGRVSDQQRPRIPYFGGEIFAATLPALRDIDSRVDPLWARIVANEPDAPREEAHFLSILYAIIGYAPGTANGFIRRMWTTFHHHNLARSDLDLMIWHLPAEKKTGFAELFEGLEGARGDYRRPAALGFTETNYRRCMGVPRRRPIKLARDLSAKILEKLRR